MKFKTVLGTIRPLRKRHFTILMGIMLCVPALYGQGFKIIESNGLAAVISGGRNNNIKKGDILSVLRLEEDVWVELTFAEVTHARGDMARIQVADGAPLVSLRVGDQVRKLRVQEDPGGRQNGQTSTKASYQLLMRRDPTGQYLGPFLGVLIPTGKLRDYFNTTVGYGGMIGNRFKNDWDIAVRFFYASQDIKAEWTMWNLQFLGKKHYNQRMIFDFGYEIAYRGLEGYDYLANKSGNFKLGFIGGMGLAIPISRSARFEVSGLIHYYPSFIEYSAQYFTIEARLGL